MKGREEHGNESITNVVALNIQQNVLLILTNENSRKPLSFNVIIKDDSISTTGAYLMFR